MFDTRKGIGVLNWPVSNRANICEGVRMAGVGQGGIGREASGALVSTSKVI